MQKNDTGIMFIAKNEPCLVCENTTAMQNEKTAPSTWTMCKLSTVCTLGSGTTPPSTEAGWYTDELKDGAFWITTSELRENVITGAKRTVSKNAINTFTALKKHQPGTVLVAMYGATIGRVGFLAVEATTNQACCAIRPKRGGMAGKFLFYWFQQAQQDLVERGNGGGQPNVSQSIIASLRLLAPPLKEQQAIANFLDFETSIIDEKIGLISRKQELLAELRKATIHEAVTKGLDKAVCMKNSTVNWMGEIPAPWRLSKLKNVCKLQNGDWGDEPDVQNEGIVCYRKADFLGNIITNGQTRRFISKKPFVEKYDILIEKSGGGDVNPVGSVAMVMNAEPAACSNFIARIRANEKKEAKYLFYFLIAQYNSPHIYNLFNQTTGIQNINMQRLMSCIYPSPPSWEQQEISEFLDRETELIDQQLALLTRQIELFREQRKALIHEVVTGKMRVI